MNTKQFNLKQLSELKQLIDLKHLDFMKKTLLALASTALVGGIAYKALKGNKGKDEKGQRASSAKKGGRASESDENYSKMFADEYKKLKSQYSGELKDGLRMVSDFKKKLDKADDKVREKYADIVDELEKRSEKLQKRVDSVKEVGKEKWEDLKKEFKTEFADFAKSAKGLHLTKTEETSKAEAKS